MTKYQILLGFVCVLNYGSLQAATKADTLYLNQGQFVTIDTVSMPAAAFNRSANYEMQSKIIEGFAGDTLLLTVFNSFTTAHLFYIKNLTLTAITIPGGGSVTLTLPLTQQGVYRYYDDTTYPDFAYFGASGMLVVHTPGNYKSFYWDIRAHDQNFNNTIASGASPNYATFNPLYYTVNSLSYIQSTNDTLATVMAMVGDTIRIFIANNGLMDHSLHFHGFHIKILYDSRPTPNRIGWIKDSFYVKTGDTMMVEMVPHQPGMYPVHDHNLMSNLGNGSYPNGMMMMMHIQ